MTDPTGALDEAIEAQRKAEGWDGAVVGWVVLVATVTYEGDEEKSGVETIYAEGGLQWPLALGIVEAARLKIQQGFLGDG